HFAEEIKVVEHPVDLSATFTMGLALCFDAFDILGLDVFLVEFSADFPSTYVVGSQLLAFVVAVVGVDPSGDGSVKRRALSVRRGHHFRVVWNCRERRASSRGDSVVESR